MKIISQYIQELNLFFNKALRNRTTLDSSAIKEARWRTLIRDEE
jgi:hypothetical protein